MVGIEHDMATTRQSFQAVAGLLNQIAAASVLKPPESTVSEQGAFIDEEKV